MIYGSYLYDMYSLSQALVALDYSFTCYGKDFRQVKSFKGSIDFNVAVVDGLDRARKVQADTIFVVDSKPALIHSNVDKSLFVKHKNDKSLQIHLKRLIRCKLKINLQIKEPSLQTIIDKITTKSILTDIQTLVNKVQPYDFRKQIHKTIISYFYGETSMSEVQHLLSSAERLSALLVTMKSDKAKVIRNAVLEYRQCKDDELVAKKYKIHTFEILYIYNSFGKLESDNHN